MSYFFETLPLHPQPKRLESFSSYLTRLAGVNGTRQVSGILGLFWRDPNLMRGVADLPPVTFGTLPTAANCTETTLLRTTFYHLGLKFRRSVDPQGLGQFLAESLTPYLRYCPACLAKRPFYSLLWRFHCLSGCSKHRLKLLDRCGYCGKQIPLFAPPLKIGKCPTCGAKLRRCPKIPLTEEEWQIASARTKDLIFLLKPQPWEATNETMLTAIGEEFARLRQAKGLKQTEVADQLKVPLGNILRMERKALRPNGQIEHVYVPFHRYLAYADLLGVTLSEIFSRALAREETGKKALSLDAGDEVPQKDKPQTREEDVLAQVYRAIQDLKTRGLPITQQAIAQLVGLSLSGLRYYPKVKALLPQIEDERLQGLKERTLKREEEVLALVEQAVEQIVTQGQPLTLQAIVQAVHLSESCLKRYPRVTEFLEQARDQYPTALARRQQREEDLVEKVQVAIPLLQAQGQQVTQQAIADQVGVSLGCLKAYSRVNALLPTQDRAGSQKVDPTSDDGREQDLLSKVQQSIERLAALEKPITWEAISQEVGEPAWQLCRYQTIREVFTRAAPLRQQAHKQQRQEIEKERLAEVQQAIEQLEAAEQPVTLVAIENIIGRSVEALRRYPRVNALFVKVTEAAPQARIKRAQIREDELLKLVKEAVHQLEASGLPATKEAVGEIVHLYRHGFSRYPRILAFWDEVTAQRAQALEEQTKLREEELLQQVRAAIESLESCGKPVTLRAIQAMVGMSIVALKAYPRIDQLFTAVVQAGQHARKQVTEANSTEG